MHDETCSSPQFRLRLDAAAMAFHDAAADGQPQAHSVSRFFSGQKRLENLWQNLRRDAAAVVAYPQLQLAAVGRRRRAQPQVPAARHGRSEERRVGKESGTPRAQEQRKKMNTLLGA